MRQLIPLVVGVVVAGVLFVVMQAFVWQLLHGGPEMRARWEGFGGMVFWIAPVVGGSLAGWLVHWFMD